jgi:hypothetical protein
LIARVIPAPKTDESLWASVTAATESGSFERTPPEMSQPAGFFDVRIGACRP